MEINQISSNRLNNYEKLLKICFPGKNFTEEYLDWLYFKNPLGHVVGFDALYNGDVIAHYACIPTKVDNFIGLLSLNTATHPSFRSQGLHVKLAKMTYEYAQNNFDFVIGVANNNSAKNFINKLDFVALGKLNLRWGLLARDSTGVRKWTSEEIEWRLNSPKTKFEAFKNSKGTIYLYCYLSKSPIKLKAQVILDCEKFPIAPKKFMLPVGFTIDFNLNSRVMLQLPELLKPSPLILIFKQLNSKKINVNSWSFPDFDAY